MEWEKLEKVRLCCGQHKIRKDQQRAAFHATITGLKEGEAVILMDFKENIKVGGGPRETSSWWNKIQFTMLDILVITAQGFHFYDFISKDLTHDSVFVKSCFEDLLKMQSFKDKKITKLHAWSDGGPHFHNFHLCDFFYQFEKQQRLWIDFC